MKFIKKFKSLSDAKAQGTNGLSSPHVDSINGFTVVNYHKSKYDNFEADFTSEGKIVPLDRYYVSFTTASAQTLLLSGISSTTVISPNFEYSYDRSVWKAWDYTALPFGTEGRYSLYLRGKNPNGLNTVNNAFYFTYGSSNGVALNVGGNIMALIDYDNPPLDIPSEYCFTYLFNKCFNLGSVASDFLPATGLTTGCYYRMFGNCSFLATTPNLPAETLVEKCYSYMFAGCSTLKEAHCDALDITATDCTLKWILYPLSSGDFYGKTAANWTDGANGIPTGWTKHLS